MVVHVLRTSAVLIRSTTAHRNNFFRSKALNILFNFLFALLPLLGGTSFNIAGSINNRGEVVGTSQSSEDGNVHAFLWTKETGIHDLGAFPGAVATVAPCCNTTNDRGEVVGFSVDANFNTRAFVWKDNVLMDLNRLIPKDSPWYLQAAESLNDAGEITGYGMIHGETHAFLATPCHRHEDGRECCEDHDR